MTDGERRRLLASGLVKPTSETGADIRQHAGLRQDTQEGERYTLHPTPYTLHPTPFILLPSPFNRNPNPSLHTPNPKHTQMNADPKIPTPNPPPQKAAIENPRAPGETLEGYLAHKDPRGVPS